MKIRRQEAKYGRGILCLLSLGKRCPRSALCKKYDGRYVRLRASNYLKTL